MMRYLLYLVFSFCLISSGFSQSDERDSLVNIIETSSDTLKVRALLELAKKLRFEAPDTSDSLFNTGINYAQNINDNKGEVLGYTGKGISAGIRGDYPEAVLQFKNVLAVSRQNKMTRNEASALNNLGIVYKRLGDYPKSMEFYKQALDINNNNQDSAGISKVYDNLGVISDLMGEFEQAKGYYKRALFFNNIENLRSEGMASTFLNLGVLFFKERNYDSALYYMLKSKNAHSLDQNKMSSTGYINSLNNLGILHIENSNYIQAESYLKEALSLLEQNNITSIKSSVLHNLANIALKKGNLKIALQYALKCDSAALQSNMKEKITDAKEILSKIYEEMGLYPQALENHKLYQVYSDSILNEQKVRDYENHKVILEVSEKDRQLQLQSLELNLLESNLTVEKQWRWGLFIILSLTGLSLMLVFQKYVQRKRINRDLQQKNEIISQQKLEIETMNLELEKRMLRAQLNPHFIFNALNSIQHFITANDRPSALKYLSRFSSLLRQILESSINLKLVLEEDIKMLTIYLELESLRFDHAFQFEIIVDEEIDQYNFEMPAMILQPFVENAIIHGLMNKEGDKRLEIRFSDQENSVNCCVIDNGIGREKAAEIKSKTEKSRQSRGLEVIRKRLLSHNGDSIENPIVFTDLQDEQGNSCGTRVCITINK